MNHATNGKEDHRQGEFAGRIRRWWPWLAIVLLVGEMMRVYLAWHQLSSNCGSTTKSVVYTNNNITAAGTSANKVNTNTVDSSSSSNARKWEFNEVVYGHVHISKTAGTEINGELALLYERICGHKGYSLDAYSHTNRGEKWVKEHPAKFFHESSVQDSFSQLRGGFNRGRVPPPVMMEAGYHDCDWCSIEDSFGAWQTIAKQIYPVPLELHVPCRQPIDHFLSMCNFKHLQFNCSIADEEIPKEANKCIMDMNRFNDSQLANWNKTIASTLSIKCFNPIPIQPYLDYMAPKLQPRRFTRPYLHVNTNLKRKKDKECLLQDETLQEKVKQYLITRFPIFRFCNQCSGSENDLFAAGASSSSH